MAGWLLKYAPTRPPYQGQSYSVSAAEWTARRRPVCLVYSERAYDERSAIRREAQLKGWSRAKKEALVRGDIAALRQLSKSSSSPARTGW